MCSNEAEYVVGIDTVIDIVRAIEKEVGLATEAYVFHSGDGRDPYLSIKVRATDDVLVPGDRVIIRDGRLYVSRVVPDDQSKSGQQPGGE